MSVPHPYPHGWYRFRYGHELGRGRVVAGRFFGVPLVAFRTERGAVRVLDAHCAHLGAHLGDGRVLGESLQCPFHGWLYDTDGRCEHVPFADAVPRGACVRAYPTVERNGIVWFWHDTTGGPPTFELPLVPETEDPGWRRGPVHRRAIRSWIQDPRENAIDVAHGPVLHARSFPPYPGTVGEVLGWEERGPTLRFELAATYGRPGKPFRTTIRFELAGPGHLVMRSALPTDVLFLVPITPVDEDHIVFTIQSWVRRSRVPLLDRALVWYALRHLLGGLYEDYVVFEKKRYLREPLLSDADGPILEMRRWMAQFYPPEVRAELAGEARPAAPTAARSPAPRGATR